MTERIDPPAWMQAPALAAVLDALTAAGGPDAARFVGGCVRDTLLGRTVADIDIATVLPPEETQRALKAAKLRSVPTGIEHGTVTAISGGRPFEITTLRRDVETDGRRAVVAFTRDWSEDAQRRDFRLNALYLDRAGQLYDPTGGGIADARAGRIIFVGDARTRIREDYLRILRFFRFLAWFGRGAPDAEALRACAELRAGLEGLSGERVSKELLKLLAAPDPRPALGWMAEAGVLAAVLPEAVDLARFERAALLTGDPLLRLAALAPDDPSAARRIAGRLRLSNAEALRLIAAAAGPIALAINPTEARRLLYVLGAEAFADRAILTGAATGGDPEPLAALARTWERPRLPVGGEDAKALGFSEGRAIGQLLKEIEAWWIAEDFAPGRVEALEHLANISGTVSERQ
jgi:poly(A) polymerase